MNSLIIDKLEEIEQVENIINASELDWILKGKSGKIYNFSE